MYIIWKTVNTGGFSSKEPCAFLLQENIKELSELNTLKSRKNENSFHIIDQMKVGRVPL